MDIQTVFVLLKPDCIVRKLIDSFLTELKKQNLFVRRMHECRLTQGMAQIIYQDCISEYFYPDLENFILSGPCVAIAIQGQDAVNKILALKKDFRKKHSMHWIELSAEDILLWENNIHPNQQILNIKLTAENLLHASDTESESKKIIKLFFGADI